MKNSVYILAFLIGLSGSLAAQEVTFSGSAKATVREGEQFRLTYTVNADASGFQAPEINNFLVLSGPNQSSNRSYQIINGQVAQSFQLTYTFFLKATGEGEYEIPPARINVDGREISSNPVKIRVIKGGASSSRQGSSSSGGGQPTTPEGISDEDVFIRASIDKKNPYQGEQVIITYKIYTTVPISQIDIKKLSTFPGFWYNDLKDNNESLRQYNEVINGKEYVVADLRKIALFPQRTGKIVIEPLELECLAQVRVQSSTRSRDPFFDSFFDDPFFNRNIRNIPLSLKSNPLEINIKSLPTQSRPAGFSGAVGNFQLQTTIDKTELKTNEAISLKATIRGKGNIELIDEIPFAFPPDFEVFDPKVSNQITKTPTGISGTRTFEYLVIPRSAGEFEIKPATFTFFDPQKQEYVSVLTPEYSISVEKSDEEPAGISYSGVSQKDIQFIGSDIRHIKSYPFKLYQVDSYFYLSRSYYLLLALPAIIVVTLIILWRIRKRKRQDAALIRTRQATRVARKNLKLAGEFLKRGEENKFYEELSRSLWGYLSNKFNIPLSELSMENVSVKLKSKKVQDDTVEAFTGVLSNCEYARFAPGGSSERMNDLYDQAISIITRTEREIK